MKKNIGLPVMLCFWTLCLAAGGFAFAAFSSISSPQKPDEVAAGAPLPLEAPPVLRSPEGAGKGKEEAGIPFQLVAASPLPKNPLQLSSPKKEFTEGKLAYIADLPVKGLESWQQFLFLREPQGPGKRVRTSVYHIKSPA